MNNLEMILKQTEEDSKMARKWSHQAKVLSVVALIVNIISEVLQSIGIL